MATITFKPKQVVKNLLSVLPPRARDVLVSRYGLGKETRKMTLDSIGKKYGITRERVRQIENYAVTQLKKTKNFKDEEPAFVELKKFFGEIGSVVSEHDLLNHVSKDKIVQNHIHFMLVLGDDFTKEKEDDHFTHRWHIDKNISEKVHEALRKLYKSLKDEDIIPEAEIIQQFLKHLEGVSEEYKNDEIIKRWLSISKLVSKNPLGEWGLSDSSNIKAKGMRDFAYLAIRKHGSPIHFREVAKSIATLFGKKAHVATTHNELIKDKRFVLVGRGLYALSEWGYMTGVVKDVIKKILEKDGHLTKKQVIEKVLKERYVKENTILVNLQNPKYFKKDKDGKYSIVSVK